MSAAEKDVHVDPESFAFLRDHLRSLTGITLAASKTDLVRSRLRRRLGELNLDSFAAYVAYLRSLPSNHQEHQLLVNSMTTNKTDFFREPEHFDLLANQLLPELSKAGANKVAIWSAACSTGEEPYTIAMVAQRALAFSRTQLEIVGTDIDTEVIGYAKNGVYPRGRLSEVPGEYQSAFASGSGAISNWVKVRSSIRQGVSFQPINLVEGSFPWQKYFDIVFCRNVLIYFSPDIVQRVVNNLYRAAKPGATLLIGHSESLQAVSTEWQYVRPSVYKKPDQA